MKRSIVVIIIILALVISGGFLQNRKIKSIHKNSVEKLELISHSLDVGSYNEARDKFQTYEKYWVKSKKLLTLIISHDELDAITNHNSRLNAYLNERGVLDAYAEIGELTDIYSELEEKFRLSLRNIL